jgi:L-ascorbate metabolism protein UlaG (beta-lactamase superfamily)
MLIVSLIWVGSCSDEEKTPCTVPIVSAGDDQTLVDETSVPLSGVSSENQGEWTILEGEGGEIIKGNPVLLIGKLDMVYKLKWESANACGTSSDEVTITLNEGCGDGQTIDEMVSNMHWIQQACFRIETAKYTIYTDPNSITQKDTADIILITHPHGDHYTAAGLDLLSGPNTILIAPQDVTYSGTIGQRVVLTPGQTHEAFGCITIKAVHAYNINKTQYHLKSNNWVGYLITVDGVTIYTAGDTERIPEMKNFTCDIAMLPLGQTYTFDSVVDAAEAAKDVKAKVAIPMHYGLYEGTEADAVTFKNLLDGVIPVVIKERGQ